jgi:Protein of unknown function (DUF3987)
VKNIADICDLSSGLVREIYDHVSLVSRELPEFRIASALMIVGACAQRSRVFPGRTGTNINLILAGPSSTTKTFFLNYIQRHLADVAPELVCPGFASEIGLQEVMSGGPSRCLAQDEIGQRIESAYLEKREHAQAWVQGLLKYSEPTNMPAQVRRSGTVPAVEHAVLSIAGTMTTDTLKRLFAQSRFISDGLASRFLFFIHPEMLPVSLADQPNWAPDAKIVRKLRAECARTSIALDVSSGGSSHDLKLRKQLTDSKDWIMTAKKQFAADTQSEFEALERDEKELVNSIRDRMVATVAKLSQIHCIGRGVDDVGEQDATFAVAMVNWLWTHTVRDILGFKDDEQLALESIALFCRNKMLTIGMLKKSGPRRIRSLSFRDVERMCYHLVSEGILKKEDLSGKAYFSLNAPKLAVCR